MDQYELQVMFLVAGGESASSINTPGGIWAMATSLKCDKNKDGSITDSDGEYWVLLDSVQLLDSKSSPYSMNGYSQFGERQGSSNSNTWDATFGVIAHELGHAYFDIPDLYCTSGDCKGIGKFGLMGGGSWGLKSSSEKSGATPVHMNAWTKKKISACSPTIADNGTISYT
ncbi:MAG: immune inhibitor A, partial [SAR324 cluster bacterium]|nr:immune inhibitor A [SAR324 cluster bacterium]